MKNHSPARTLVQPARRIAAEVIRAVREDEAYANLLLPHKLARAKLNNADAALATELCYGTLRLRGYYDLVIEIASHRNITEIDGPIRDVLELAAHQLLSMRTASHAAVNESVELARIVGSRSSVGFVNGVLRSISKLSAEEWRERVVGEMPDDDSRREALFAHPAWIIRSFRRALKAEHDFTAAELDDALTALLQANNEPARVTLVALPGYADRSLWKDHAENTRFSPFGFVHNSSDPRTVPEVLKGTVRVQDEGSQLAALAVSRAKPIQEKELWLDLCAGPGGKSALLAAEAERAGAILICNEPVAARAQLVREALSIFSPKPEVWCEDGRVIGEKHPERFDRILLDAPCSGLGALRRRPEARWRKNPRDLAELVALQSELLDAAIQALKPGGILAYVTCSPHLAETRGQISAAHKRHPHLLDSVNTQAVLDSFTSELLTLGTTLHGVQLWPHQHQSDAMFISLLQKKFVAS